MREVEVVNRRPFERMDLIHTGHLSQRVITGLVVDARAVVDGRIADAPDIGGGIVGMVVDLLSRASPRGTVNAELAPERLIIADLQVAFEPLVELTCGPVVGGQAIYGLVG
jgi:hypothetical protein